jgi:hypothetical protein
MVPEASGLKPLFSRIPLELILVENSTYTGSAHLKKRLIAEGILENRCQCCGISEWLGQPLSLHLHHVSGNNHDNRLSNLRLLCPNCHSQTDTYCGKSLKKSRLCPDCGRQRGRQSTRCRSCANRLKNSDKIVWPPAEELRRRVQESSCLAVARQLGVSDNAVRRKLAKLS